MRSRSEAELLGHLGEVDTRRLYLGEGGSSMFAYCVRVLHFAESAAYKRIAAARRMTADAIRRLRADRQPKPEVPTSVRRVATQSGSIPEPKTISNPTPSTLVREARTERARSEPLGGERYCVRFTADPELHAQIQELRALMRHQMPDGDVGVAALYPRAAGDVRGGSSWSCITCSHGPGPGPMSWRT